MAKNERMLKCSKLSEKKFQFFNDMKNRKELCDVTFQVGNESISAHRIIVTAVIPYFREVFSSRSAQTTDDDLCVPDIEPSSFKCLIDFAYSHEVKIDSGNVRSLLVASCYLGVDEVREACCDYLAESLKPENVLPILELAQKLNCSELSKNVFYFVKENFHEMSLTKDFLRFDLEFLKELVSDDDLNVESEEHVLEGVLKWVKDDPDSRKIILPELLRSVRLHLLEPLYLTKFTEREELIRTSTLCRDLFDEAKNYNLYPEMRKSKCSFSTAQLRSLKYSNLTQERGEEYIYGLHYLMRFTMHRLDTAKPSCSTELNRDYYENFGSAANLHNKMYYFVWGYTFEYDPMNNVYKFLNDDSTPRCCLGATSLNDKIYLCGGRLGPKALSLVEYYEPEKNEWTEVSHMNSCRCGPSVVTLGKYIFALGGHDSNSVHNSTERYDPVRNKWENKSPMLTKRCYAGAAALNGKIYVCGGKKMPTGDQAIETAEVYDPIKNTWKTISPMKNVGGSLFLLPCRGKIYALGGNDIPGKLVYNLEIYDPDVNKWTIISDTDTGHPTSSAVVMSITGPPKKIKK